MNRSHRPQYSVQNEEGFVLVVALMILVILSLIGIAGLTTSTFEKQIAGNDWNAKRTFYRADGGLSQGIELIEQNLACGNGFNNGAGVNVLIEDQFFVLEQDGNNLRFSGNKALDKDTLIKADRKCFLNPATEQLFDVVYPADADGNFPSHDVGFLYVGSEKKELPGGALQMAAGYEGKGKSSAQGGVAMIMDIYSQYLGPKNSESIISAVWLHTIGNEGNCKY